MQKSVGTIEVWIKEKDFCDETLEEAISFEIFNDEEKHLTERLAWKWKENL